MVPNRPNFISIEILGWLQANKQKATFGPTDAALPTEQQTNFGTWLILDEQVCSQYCATESRFGPQNAPIGPQAAGQVGRIGFRFVLFLGSWHPDM
jgi:hypothetical protein